MMHGLQQHLCSSRLQELAGVPTLDLWSRCIWVVHHRHPQPCLGLGSDSVGNQHVCVQVVEVMMCF